MVLIYQRLDAATDDVDWNDNIEGASIGSEVSLILEYETRDGAGPRLHRHPYTETFVVRRGPAPSRDEYTKISETCDPIVTPSTSSFQPWSSVAPSGRS